MTLREYDDWTGQHLFQFRPEDPPPTYAAPVAAMCPHGLPASECLICPTLPQKASGLPPEEPRRGSGVHLVGVVGAIVVIGLIAWAVAGVVFALFHVLELAAVAAVAGWAGYRLGRLRGPRSGH